METMEPASLNAELLDRDDGAEPVMVAPPVVAVVVTTDPGPGFTQTLNSLGAQDYPSLSVLVLDDGSTEDPTARIAAALPTAFVRRRPRGPRPRGGNGFAEAANDALAAIEGAVFLLFCHDDVALDPDAVRIMVEEAYRSNAGVVGPKIVDAEHPELLLEVGMAVDHYAVPFSGIEPDEVDQEQHDAVRDVFYVSHAAMLVRADLFHELAGFDVATSPGADDLDLCWRARLAGARVIVAPAARVRRPSPTAASGERRKLPARVRAETSARVRVLCKSYSGLALAWVLPSAFLLAIFESIGLLVTGHVARSRAVMAGWLSVLLHPHELRQARHATQQLRRVDDGDVRDLMIRGSARVRSFVLQRVHADDRIAEVSNRTRARVNDAATRLRRAPAIVAMVLAVLVLFGTRSLFLGRVPEVGGFRSWPDVGNSWATFTASWRTTMMGAPHAASPVFGMMALFSSLLLGHTGLARSIVIAGAVPLGAVGAYRLVRRFSTSALAGVAAAVAYAANPIARNAIWRGELGPLVCFAFAPFVLHAFVRVLDDDADRRDAVHAVAALALIGLVTGALWPPAIVFGLLVTIACVLALPFVGTGQRTTRLVLVGVVATIATIMLLAPWSFSLLGADAATFGAVPRTPLTLASILHFHTGRAGAGLASWGILAAAIVPLAIARGPRLVWATRAWVLAILSFTLVWLPGRISPGASTLAPEGLLVGAAVGFAFAAGLGVAAVLDDLRRFHFGWRQIMLFVAAIGLGWSVLGLTGDTLSGRFGLSATDWPSTYSWMSLHQPPGGFRVLWVGDPAILPADGKVDGPVGYAFTRDGSGDARALWAAPESKADRVVGDALRAASSGSTARLGHLLAPAGVRYVAFIQRAAPDAGPYGRNEAALADGLARQLDLTVAAVDDQGVVYQNDAWIAMHSLVPPTSNSTTRVDAPDPLPAALRSEPDGVQGVPAPAGRTPAVGPGTLLWSEAANSHWSARVNGHAVARRDAFGWTNAFALGDNAPVHVTYRGGASLPGRLLVLALWAAAIAVWFRSRRRAVARPARTDANA